MYVYKRATCNLKINGKCYSFPHKDKQSKVILMIYELAKLYL